MNIYSIRRVKERANDKGRRGCQGKRLWIAFFLCLGTAFFSHALFFTRSRFAGTDNKGYLLLGLSLTSAIGHHSFL